MKPAITIFVLCLITCSNLIAQRFKVRQSMETADLREEPAQFQINIPKEGRPHYIINVGTSFRLDNNGAKNYLSKLVGEYHKNTNADEEQDNFQIGYAYTWNFATRGTTDFFLSGDLEYIFNRFDGVHSIGSNQLFTWARDASNLNWNTNNFFAGNSRSFFLSLFAGTQLQYIMNSKSDNEKGVILRPLITANASFSFNNPSAAPYRPIVTVGVYYTGRTDVVNSTALEEGYTNLLKCSIDWFISNGPVKVSIGASYNTGSDPMKGLKNQSYWLFSVNFLK
jgi:hypothetical protein